MRTQRTGLGAFAAATVILGGAPTALAAPSVQLDAGVLTVTGEGGDEAFDVRTSAANIRITGMAGATPPGGCALEAGNLDCPDTSIGRVVLRGGGGRDTLTLSRTGTGGDTHELLGGPGGDAISVTPGAAIGATTLDGQEGDDVLTKNAFGGGGTVFRGGFPDTSVVLLGGDGNDHLHAGTGAFSFADDAGPGDDTFHGGPYSDAMYGEPGADTYNGGTLPAPSPAPATYDPDTYQRTNAPDVVSYAEKGQRVVAAPGGGPDGEPGENDSLGADIEGIDGSAHGDVLQAGGGSVTLFGGGGDDQIGGGPVADVLDGGSGNDVVSGGPGDDDLYDGDVTPHVAGPTPPPGPGNDRLSGDDGNDYLSTDRGADDIQGGPGRDETDFFRPITEPEGSTAPARPQPFEISLDDQANDGARGAGEGDNVHSDVEDVETGNGDDVVRGSAAANRIATNIGNDDVDPGPGADVVDAGRGADTIRAQDGVTDRVDCGRDGDSATVDLGGGQPEKADVTIDCETIAGAPLPDQTRPALRLTGRTTVKSRTFRRRGRLPAVYVECFESCAVHGEALRSGARLAATGQLSVGQRSLPLKNGRRTLSIKVADRFRRTLVRKLRKRSTRRRGITFTIRVTATDAAGNIAVGSRRVKIKG